MTPEQIANMQAGRKAAAEARRIEQYRLMNDDDAAVERERRQRAYADLLRLRKGQPGWD